MCVCLGMYVLCAYLHVCVCLHVCVSGRLCKCDCVCVSMSLCVSLRHLEKLCTNAGMAHSCCPGGIPPLPCDHSNENNSRGGQEGLMEGFRGSSLASRADVSV